MAAPFDVAKVGSAPEPLQRRFQPVRRPVEIEGVGRTHGQVDLPVEIMPEVRPVAAEEFRDVVMLLPIRDHGRVDRARRAVEHADREPVGAAWREDPLE
jgi:hypothetical protein